MNYLGFRRALQRENPDPSGLMVGGMALTGGLAGLADQMERHLREKREDAWRQQEMDLRKQEFQARLAEAHSEHERQTMIDEEHKREHEDEMAYRRDQLKRQTGWDEPAPEAPQDPNFVGPPEPNYLKRPRTIHHMGTDESLNEYRQQVEDLKAQHEQYVENKPEKESFSPLQLEDETGNAVIVPWNVHAGTAGSPASLPPGLKRKGSKNAEQEAINATIEYIAKGNVSKDDALAHYNGQRQKWHLPPVADLPTAISTVHEKAKVSSKFGLNSPAPAAGGAPPPPPLNPNRRLANYHPGIPSASPPPESASTERWERGPDGQLHKVSS